MLLKMKYYSKNVFIATMTFNYFTLK